METQFTFTLPRGYVDSEGACHRTGVMRLATARDASETPQVPRASGNEPYLPVLLLRRVIPSLGEIVHLTPEIVEGLFASDFAFLEDLYERLNAAEPVLVGVNCPSCSTPFHVRTSVLG
jgi:hypothetical protein